MSYSKSTTAEFIDTLSKPHLWAVLAWFDIKQRYRRSKLGPFWVTLTTSIYILALSFVWSNLFKMEVENFLPSFAVGYVFWVFISTQLNDACSTFSQFEGTIKQTRLPFPSFVLRLLSRNIIVFFHNMVIVIFVVIFSPKGLSYLSLLSIIGLLLTGVCLWFTSIVLASICTRFRDVTEIVQNIVAICFFITPVIWQKQSLAEGYWWVIEYNPLNYFIDIFRNPILGISVPIHTWLIASMITILVAILAWVTMYFSRNKLAYWL